MPGRCQKPPLKSFVIPRWPTFLSYALLRIQSQCTARCNIAKKTTNAHQIEWKHKIVSHDKFVAFLKWTFASVSLSFRLSPALSLFLSSQSFSFSLVLFISSVILNHVLYHRTWRTNETVYTKMWRIRPIHAFDDLSLSLFFSLSFSLSLFLSFFSSAVSSILKTYWFVSKFGHVAKPLVPAVIFFLNHNGAYRVMKTFHNLNVYNCEQMFLNCLQMI